MQNVAPQASAAASFLSDLYSQVAKLFSNGTVRRVFEVAGMSVELVCPKQLSSDIVDRYLASLSARPALASQVEAPITIWLAEASSAGNTLRAMDWLMTEGKRIGPLHRHSDVRFTMLYNTHSQVLSAFDAELGVGLQLVSEFKKLPKFELASPLRELLGWSLSKCGRPLIHASAISDATGRGAILVGPSGSGKSTTAAIATQFSDLAFVSDDFCVVSLTDGIPKVQSLFRSAKLMPRWDAALPNLEAGDFCVEMGKTVYNIPTDQVQPDASIECIYLPLVCDLDESDVSFVGPGAAMRRLAPSTLFQHAGTGPHEMRMMADLVRRIPAFELRLGKDPIQLAGLLAAHLGGLK